MADELMRYADKIAIELFGAIPVGTFCGMPVMADPRVPNDRFRLVDPVSGRYSDFPIPDA